MTLVLTGFRPILPAHALRQSDSLDWLAKAHTQAERTLAASEGRPFDAATFLQHMQRRMTRFGCGEDKIASRRHELGDFAHCHWQEMDVYRLETRAEGEGMLARTRFFDQHARGILERMYAEDGAPPSDLVHVTCTGYVSPSAAQRLVAAKGWGAATRVTHAYHMGCYAAFPALRMAAGFLSAPDSLRAAGPKRVDVVHTEMCSLHMNPLHHEAEQLVVQSLFADGFIRYSLCDADDYEGSSPPLALLSQDELVVPDSGESMSWICGDSGMQMTLARDVPARLAKEIRGFVRDLCARAGLNAAERERALFAVHPGGPRILDGVRDALGVDERQMAFSRRVLRERGNMSSATVPHIWMEIERSREVTVGEPIVSLAFGPGLTLCGAVLRKGLA